MNKPSFETSAPLPEQPPWLLGSVQAWGAHTLDRQRLRQSAGQLRHHPRFATAKRQFALNMLQAFETHAPLNRLLRGEGELAFLAFVLALHHERDPDDPDSGATYSRVLELFAVLEVGSPTLVKALLALTRIRGLLKVEPAGGRKKRLIPSDKLLQTLLVWLRANLKAVEILADLPEPADQLAAKPEMLYMIYRFGVDAYRHNRFILSEEFPAVRTFMTRRNGYLVLMSIIASLQSRQDGVFIAAVPTADLSAKLSISRGTVRNLLNVAQQHGWVGQMSRGSHQIEISPEFFEICEDWMSMELAWMQGVANTAWRVLA
jgi:hypothetical protein